MAEVKEAMGINGTRRGIDSFRDKAFDIAIANLKLVIPKYNDGKSSYENTDYVPFTSEHAIDAVANFANARISRVIDGDQLRYASFMSDYMKARQACYIDEKEQDRNSSHDLLHIRGDTIPFNIRPSTDEAGMAWASFASYTLTFTVRRGSSYGPIVGQLNDAPGGGIIAGTYAYWEFDTANLNAGVDYYYDIQMTSKINNATITLRHGKIKLLNDSTR